MRRRSRTTCVSRAVCFFLPWRVTSLAVSRLTASSASLIEADKSPWYLRFARSSLSRPTSKRTLKTSKPTFLRIATGRANHPLRSHRSKILVAVCSVRYIHVPGIPFKQGPKRLLVLTPFSVAGAAGGTLFFSWLIATAEYLLQSGFVSSRHFLCCVPKNLCVSELSPCPSPSQHIFWRLNHAGQNILQEGIRQSKLGIAKVKSDCSSFVTFARVAAMRASSCIVASVLSPSRSCCSQAAIRNACSERKPRFLTAARTSSRSSPEGYR